MRYTVRPPPAWLEWVGTCTGLLSHHIVPGAVLSRSSRQTPLCRPPPQALPVLQAVIPLRRANMRLRIQVAPQAEQDLELLLRQQHAIIESQEALPSQARQLGDRRMSSHRTKDHHELVSSAASGPQPCTANLVLGGLDTEVHRQYSVPARLQVTVICLAEPGCFRGLHSFVQGAAGGGGRLEVRSAPPCVCWLPHNAWRG